MIRSQDQSLDGDRPSSSDEPSKDSGSETVRESVKMTEVEELFAAALEQHYGDEELDIDELCRQHPAYDSELRRLHARVQRVRPVMRRFFHSNASVRIRKKFGEDVDPLVSLKDDSLPAFLNETSPDDPLVEQMQERKHLSNRYHVKERLAQGGMGTILRVWDEDLRRFLAMKVIRGEATGEAPSDAPQYHSQSLRRFLEEAQITGQLDHPSIVPVHDLGIDETGRVFFVMRLVKGQTLRQVFEAIDQGSPEWNRTRVLNVISKACDAIAYAHSKEVIHRDLKPSNIMVGRFGETYVMDWGLAKVLGAETEKPSQPKEKAPTRSVVRTHRSHQRSSDLDRGLVTMDGDVVGTPAYMSPEQARGDVETLGARSDVYSMGAVLYHLLAGHMPYVKPGNHPKPSTVIARVIDEAPKPLHAIRKDLPDELVAISEKAMSRDVEQRYPDMIEMAEDLRAYLENRVVSAHRKGAVVEFSKWVKRNRGLAAFMGLTLMLIIGGLSGFLWMQNLANQRLATEEAKTQASLKTVRSQHLDLMAINDALQIQAYIQESDEIWPAFPQRTADMQAWLEKVRPLAYRLPYYRAALLQADLHQEVSAGVAPERLIELTRRLEDAILEKTPDYDSILAMERELEQLISTIPNHEAGIHRDSEERRRLVFLIEAIEGFTSPDPTIGTMAAMEERMARAAWLEEETEKAWELWETCLADLEEDPRFSEDTFDIQIGLVPIGTDPETKLWEFADLQTGEIPDRVDGRLEIDEESALVFVLIPGGSYQIEGNDFTLAPWFLSKFEMTQGQWERAGGTNRSDYRTGNIHGVDVNGLHPVENVTWFDCLDLTRRLGMTLPTEAQWRYAAVAGGDTEAWWTGEEVASLQGAGNLLDRSAKAINPLVSQHEKDLEDGFAPHAPAGRFAANPFGLHDVIGNVWEWCLDQFDDLPEGGRDGDGLCGAIGTGLDTNGIFKGGSFSSTANFARANMRQKSTRMFRANFVGLRPSRPVQVE